MRVCSARLYSEACWESLKGSEKGKARQTGLSISVLSHASVFVFYLFFFVSLLPCFTYGYKKKVLSLTPMSATQQIISVFFFFKLMLLFFFLYCESICVSSTYVDFFFWRGSISSLHIHTHTPCDTLLTGKEQSKQIYICVPAFGFCLHRAAQIEEINSVAFRVTEEREEKKKKNPAQLRH